MLKISLDVALLRMGLQNDLSSITSVSLTYLTYAIKCAFGYICCFIYNTFMENFEVRI